MRFPVRAHAEVAGLIPGLDAYGRQLIDVSLFLSLCLSLSSIKISVGEVFKKRFF